MTKNEAQASCPPKSVWQQILTEGFAGFSQGNLAAHLDGCPACQTAVEHLMGGQRAWLDIAAELRRELPPASAVCQRTLADFKEGKPIRSATPEGFMAKADTDNGTPVKEARRADRADSAAVVQKIIANMEKVIIGKRQQLTLALVAYLCEGHILLEDVPGVAKTMLARALARSVGCVFKRIQCTPDLLPTDVTGVSVFNQKTAEFEFRPGPIFAQTVLADEINRATPRTQAALLEAMAERRVTVDGQGYTLKPPFLVIATQNPVDHEGTFPLPEAQLDRFLIRLALGYPNIEEESKMLQRLQRGHPIDEIGAVAQAADVLAAQDAVREVHVDDKVRRYILELVKATRENDDVLLGGSPRASLALFRTAQGLAAIAGRNFVLPDDVKKMVVPVLGHRLILRPEARIRKITATTVLSRIVTEVSAPVPAHQVEENDAWK
jgi:MoxR-like ATPase